MSIRVMTMIWDSEAYSGGTLLVLLALADFAHDDGTRIYPHVDTLAKKARLSTRATQMALETLKADGVLKLVANAAGGRGKSVEYQFDMERVKNLRAPEKGADSDRKGCNPQQERVQFEAERVQSATSHIDNRQEPSLPVIEPSSAPSALVSRAKPSGIELPDWLPGDAWDGFAEMRRKIRHPLTERAGQLLIAELDRFRAAGHDPVAIINESTMKSWRGFFPPKEGPHAKSGKTTGNGTSHQRHREGWAGLIDAETGGSESVQRPGQLALEPPQSRGPS